MSDPAILDHIVINARFGMDQAESIFTDLGFTLTPRGRHSMGSINHLMMFTDDYLELIGIDEADAAKRPEVSGAPVGLNGLVFKTDNADETFKRLEAVDMAGDPPNAFSRPLVLGNGSHHEARFRTVTARADAFPAGRLYFCEHLTPELLWRQEWQTHPNTVTGFSELVLVCEQPREFAQILAKLLGLAASGPGSETEEIEFQNGFRLTLLTQGAYSERFGKLARAAAGRQSYFGAVGLKCANPDAFQAALKASADHVSEIQETNSALVAVDEFDTLIGFDL